MRIINEIELVCDEDKCILDKKDFGWFELKEREDGTKYYDGGLFNLPYASQSITLAQSIVETYEDYYYEVTKEEYKSEEFKQECLKKFIESQE